MTKITFEDLPSTNTPLDATNMNALQTNVESAISSATQNVFRSEVLWTNSTPTVAFTSQNIQLSKNVDKIDIIWKITKSSTTYIRTTIDNMNAYYQNIGMVDYKIVNRNVALSNNTVLFGGCEYVGTYGSATINNDNLIPYKIIGYTQVT